MSQQAIIRRVFGSVAARYERDVIPFFGALAASFVESIPGEVTTGRALDIGTGTGIVPRHLAARADQVIGIDIAPEMIAVACAVTQDTNVIYLTADIHQPPFRSSTFDLITASFGLNTTQPRRSLRQIRRLLKPGGWLAFQEWGPRDAASETLDQVFAAYIPDDLIETVGALTSVRSDWEDRLQDTDDYRELLAELGFTEISATESAPATVYAASIEPFIAYKLAWLPRQLPLGAMDAAARDALYTDLRTRLAQFTEPDGSFVWKPPLFRVLARSAGQ